MRSPSQTSPVITVRAFQSVSSPSSQRAARGTEPVAPTVVYIIWLCVVSDEDRFLASALGLLCQTGLMVLGILALDLNDILVTFFSPHFFQCWESVKSRVLRCQASDFTLAASLSCILVAFSWMFIFFLTVPVDTGSQYVSGVWVCGVFALNINMQVGFHISLFLLHQLFPYNAS